MDIGVNPSNWPNPYEAEVRSWLKNVGPGLVTSLADDDDPSGIAIYSRAGAWFGFDLQWTMVVTCLAMVAIQMISARLGRVSGHGLATTICRHYPA